jgi:hypothetical protein
MVDGITVQKFRFNRAFQLLGADEFLKDLFNSKEVIRQFSPLSMLEAGEVNQIKFTQMNCNVLNMSFFDILQEIKVCHANGKI